ncbi:MAG: hypothetical protein HC872_01340 [Gammaproteobacteria bacterium]|nr:hypothetical protein [Gammaproteobacteria bacterium]
MVIGLRGNTLYILIIGCEAAFWVVLFCGLAARYLLGWPRVSSILLVCVPLIDLALLVFTVVDLNRGAPATFAHGLAAAYVGFTVAFGAVVIRWADRWFAHAVGLGPTPSKPAARGWPAVWFELKLWGLCIVAVCITYVLLIGMVSFADQPEKTQALQVWFRIPLGTMFFWFLFGPLWSLVFFKRAPAATSRQPGI